MVHSTPDRSFACVIPVQVFSAKGMYGLRHLILVSHCCCNATRRDVKSETAPFFNWPAIITAMNRQTVMILSSACYERTR